MGTGRENERKKRIGIWNYWVYGDNSCIAKSQVLDQAMGAIWLFDGWDGCYRESKLGTRGT